VVIHVKKHPQYAREGPDLIVDFPITFAQAAIGAEIEIPTLDKKAKVTLPAGTQPETVFRLRGSGMPILRTSSFGDLYVRVKLKVPEKLNQEQKDLLRRFAEIEAENRGLFSKFKKKR
jgi:molecular chaperone DnaJ